MTETASSLLQGLADRNRRALSRAITHLQNDTSVGRELVGLMPESANLAFTIGITGPPGAGKSTLIGHLAPAMERRGHRVAVLLVDPSSPLTGGAVLGDRIRFSSVSGSDNIYVRSFGHRGEVGGVISSAAHVIRAVATAGFDVVIVETVGSGQSDIAITATADCTICAMPPGLGDAIQAIKAGIQEVADLFVVTKNDRPGAQQLRRQLRNIPRRPGDERSRPVFGTSSVEAEGIDDLADELDTRSRVTATEGAV